MRVRWHGAVAAVAVIAIGMLAAAGWRSGDRLFLSAGLNGLTTAALYFLVASGFSLIFGLLKNVNLAHGSLYLLGAYLGISVTDLTGSWTLGVLVGALGAALVGVALQVGIFRFLQGQDLRQALVTIGISVVLADAMLWIWGSDIYQFEPPEWMYGSIVLPVVRGYPVYKLVLIGIALVTGLLLWLLLNRTALGVMIRAGVDDRVMLGCTGVNVQVVFAATFAIGAALAGAGGVIGGSLMSVAPGEDTRYLLASLVVVIVGGMGSIVGTAIGALLVGLSEQYGLAYAPTYGVIFTFLIMTAVLAFRPNGIVGRSR